MADHVGVYWSLFQGSFPDDWKNDSEFAQYMSDLTSYSIEKLRMEPDMLQEEKRLVLNSTQKLAFNNYQAFIGTAECTREVFKEFVAVEEHVHQLLDKIPDFNEACKKFASESQVVNTKRKLNSLALSRHTQLLEVLEIPQVMETCVRNGYYEEALDLNAHVRRMHKKHGNIAIIQTIGKDVEGSMELMLQQLLQQLRGSIQLPACLRVVGFLRRMAVFSDTELRLKFLQTRDTWFQGVLAAIPKDNPYSHISKTIEVSRVHLFDIVTQYRAIFPDDDTVKLTYSSSSRGGGWGRGGAGGGDKVEGVLFYSWVNEKIWQFLHVLEEDLSRGVGGRLDSLLGQCMYFGLSFGRIGADFRSLLVPVFIRVLLNSFRMSLRIGKHEFHEAMKHLVLASPLRGFSVPHTSSSSFIVTPPHSLLDYPPLATLTNVLIQAFNDLRQCAPLAGGPEISQELQRLLESTVHDVVEYYRVEHEAFTNKDTEAYKQLVRVVLRDFLPFVKQIFTNLYSEAQVEQLALSTPYSLRHRATPTSGGTRIGTYKVGVNLNMQLNFKDIGEVLRGVASEVFEELESAERLGQERGVDMGGGMADATGGGVEVDGASDCPTQTLTSRSAESKGVEEERVIKRTEQIPAHLAIKQD